MSLTDELVGARINAGAVVDRGAIMQVVAGGVEPVDNANATGILVVARQRAPTGSVCSLTVAGRAQVRLLGGLTPAVGETVYVSATAGLGTNVPPSGAVAVGVIEDASTYSAANPLVTVLLKGPVGIVGDGFSTVGPFRASNVVAGSSVFPTDLSASFLPSLRSGRVVSASLTVGGGNISAGTVELLVGGVTIGTITSGGSNVKFLTAPTPVLFAKEALSLIQLNTSAGFLPSGSLELSVWLGIIYSRSPS